MTTGKTRTGFEYTIEEENLDDYDLLDDLVKMDSGDLTVFPRIAPLLLGEEQVKALKDHVREENGRVRFSKMMEELKDIVSLTNEVKN